MSQETKSISNISRNNSIQLFQQVNYQLIKSKHDNYDYALFLITDLIIVIVEYCCAIPTRLPIPINDLHLRSFFESHPSIAGRSIPKFLSDDYIGRFCYLFNPNMDFIIVWIHPCRQIFGAIHLDNYYLSYNDTTLYIGNIDKYIRASKSNDGLINDRIEEINEDARNKCDNNIGGKFSDDEINNEVEDVKDIEYKVYLMNTKDGIGNVFVYGYYDKKGKKIKYDERYIVEFVNERYRYFGNDIKHNAFLSKEKYEELNRNYWYDNELDLNQIKAIIS